MTHNNRGTRPRADRSVDVLAGVVLVMISMFGLGMVGCSDGGLQLENFELDPDDNEVVGTPAEFVGFKNSLGDELLGVFFAAPEPGPAPVVVALHGAGGLFADPDHNDTHLELSPQFLDWATLLHAEGYAVFFPSSFYSRGYFEWHERPGDLDETDRLVMRTYDVHAALSRVCDRSDVDCERMVLLGFSNGASVAAFAVHERITEVPRMDRLDPGPTPISSTSYYPGCGFKNLISLDEDDDSSTWYFPKIPVMVNHGNEDSLIDNCEVRLDQTRQIAAERGHEQNRYQLFVHDGAGHGFDSSPNDSDERRAQERARTRTLERFADSFDDGVVSLR